MNIFFKTFFKNKAFKDALNLILDKVIFEIIVMRISYKTGYTFLISFSKQIVLKKY
jgi:hypothetical protein